MIKIENLCYQYANGNKVLNNLSFSIKRGEFVAVIGQNGAGKTTLLKHFNGLLKPTEGNVTVCGYDVFKTKTSVIAKHIGFLFQNPDHQIFCSTVYEEIAFGLKNVNVDEQSIDVMVKEAAQKVGISSCLDLNPFSLSKGQRQRVALASVLAMGTDVMVLDEPTTGQDYQEGLEIMEIIRELNKNGKTIIIVTHDMELVSMYAKRVIVLLNGRILDDGPSEVVLGRPERLALSNLQSPQIYMLAKKFQKLGLFNNIFTVEDMFNRIVSYMEDDKNACNG